MISALDEPRYLYALQVRLVAPEAPARPWTVWSASGEVSELRIGVGGRELPLELVLEAWEEGETVRVTVRHRLSLPPAPGAPDTPVRARVHVAELKPGSQLRFDCVDPTGAELVVRWEGGTRPR